MIEEGYLTCEEAYVMDLDIIPCSTEQIKKLIEGADAFQTAYGFNGA